MCILLIAVDRLDGWPLILLGNRDEFHARATETAQPWSDAPDCLGGRDLVAGGSWLVQRNDGRFAAVTNLRTGLPARAPRSRGALERDFVLGSASVEDFADAIHANINDYGPFNLVFGERGAAWFFDGRTATLRQLPPGVHVVSNAGSDVEWPKVTRLRERFEHALVGGLPDDAVLLALLSDMHQPADELLPDTGIGIERERLLAPIFIRGEDYGTRASTLVLHHEEGSLFVRERAFAGDAIELGEVTWQCSDAESEWVLA